MLVELLQFSEMAEFVASAAFPWPHLRLRRAGAACYEDAGGRPAAEPHTQTREALEENSVERNAFSESWLMLAAEAHLIDDERIHTLVSTDGADIVGLLPVRAPRGVLALPVATVWAHRHAFETTPPLRKGAAEAFFDDLFGWLGRHRIAVLRWPRLPLEGNVADMLTQYLRRTGRKFSIVAGHPRPLLDAQAVRSGQDQVASHKRRRKVERCRRRLMELGTLTFRSFDELPDADQWAADFLRLEASGWKGETGTRTALACREPDRLFFLRVFKTAARKKRLLAYCLRLDGHPIAMALNFRSGEGVWAYKTAYDQRYARYGPGAMVEVDGTFAMLADPTIRWVDSCSDGDNELLREIWPGRRRVGEMVIAVRPGSWAGVASVFIFAELERAARALLKKAYWGVKGRRSRNR